MERDLSDSVSIHAPRIFQSTRSAWSATGCSMCGFGIHMEGRPHRFDRLRENNPREWEFWMYQMGWGRVLDYIGVEWENEPGETIGQTALW